MSQLPLQRCAEPGCRALVPRGRCLAHTKQVSKEHHSKDYQKIYNSRAWQLASKRFRAKHPLCKHCEMKGLVVASEVTDHILSVVNGGAFWDESNWQALCVPCHNLKTRQEQNERLKRGFKV